MNLVRSGPFREIVDPLITRPLLVIVVSGASFKLAISLSSTSTPLLSLVLPACTSLGDHSVNSYIYMTIYTCVTHCWVISTKSGREHHNTCS